jgi:hypothetical protein
MLCILELTSVLLIYFLASPSSLVIHESPRLFHFSFFTSVEDVVGLACTRTALLSAAYAFGMQHMHK